MSIQPMFMLFIWCFGGLNANTVGSKEDSIKWNNFVTSVNQKLHQLEGALMEKDDKIKSLEVKIDEQTDVFTRRFETQELKISQQCEELSNLKKRVALVLSKNDIDQVNQKEKDRLKEKYTGKNHTKMQSLEHRLWPYHSSKSRSMKNGKNGILKDDLLFIPNTDGDGRINDNHVSVGLYNLTYTPRKASVSSGQPTKYNHTATFSHGSVATNQSLRKFSLGELNDPSESSRRPLPKFSSEIKESPSNLGNRMDLNYLAGHTSSPRPTVCNCEVEKTEQRLKQKRVPPYTKSVAFHTTISATKTTATGNTIVYDQEILDIGDGYDPTDGVYTVPESGVYVITWTTLSLQHDYLQTRLVVNGATKGTSWTCSQGVADIHQTTAVVMLILNEGDHVFVRVGSTIEQNIYSSSYSRSVDAKPTFSGWKLN